jgi:GTPase SAR1 family protein
MARRGAEYDMQIKLLLLGDDNVGKTGLLNRFAKGDFSDSYITTIGKEKQTGLFCAVAAGNDRTYVLLLLLAM